MSDITFEQIEKQYAINPARQAILKELREEIDYWKQTTSALKAWVFGQFFGIADEPERVQLLISAVLKPPDPALPRRVINVSSGAAQTALAGESVYCVAKAGMEMLTKALAVEQQAPGFRAIAVRPGVIDTDMQVFARSQSKDVLPSVELFQGFHRDGRLVAPDVVAAKIVGRLVEDDVEHGRTYSYQEL